jgi:hypothetical protein
MYCGTPSCVLCREGIVFGRFNSVLSYRDEVCFNSVWSYRDEVWIVGPQVVSFVERYVRTYITRCPYSGESTMADDISKTLL